MPTRKRKQGKSETLLQRPILMVIAKALRKAEMKWRSCGPLDIRDFHEAKVYLLKQVYTLVRGTPPTFGKRMLQELQREYSLDHRACRNPAMKRYLRFQARTVRDLLGAVRSAT